jgi:hypothetical protein
LVRRSSPKAFDPRGPSRLRWSAWSRVSDHTFVAYYLRSPETHMLTCLISTVFQHKVLTIWGTRFLNQIGYPIQSTIAQARTGYHRLTPIQTMFLAFSAGAALKQVKSLLASQ